MACCGLGFLGIRVQNTRATLSSQQLALFSFYTVVRIANTGMCYKCKVRMFLLRSNKAQTYVEPK